MSRDRSSLAFTFAISLHFRELCNVPNNRRTRFPFPFPIFKQARSSGKIKMIKRAPRRIAPARTGRGRKVSDAGLRQTAREESQLPRSRRRSSRRTLTNRNARLRPAFRLSRPSASARCALHARERRPKRVCSARAMSFAAVPRTTSAHPRRYKDFVTKQQI